ncbi:glycerol kinase [Tuber magnatum]|uniref:glycerol kinase n=1 Tax=Tuber magnatum TaxID=42249 RepID=A0A317SSB2_9PEZI|nr:glycerol kinase [Tuber magnatum]
MGSGTSKPIKNTNGSNRLSFRTTSFPSITTTTTKQSIVPPRPKNGERETFTAAIDQGTTSSRFLIFDKSGTPRASHQVEFEQLYPHSGWIEHDPYEILKSVNECIEKATKEFFDNGYEAGDIKALGITNQRETTVVWDTKTGKPLYNAIVWPDTRTARLVHELRRKEGSERLRQLCGLPLSTYPSSVKLVWMLRHVPAVQSALKNDRLSFGTVDTWLLYNLTGGVKHGLHVTDPTNASRTMFCNINTLEYDDFLIDWFGVRGVKLPKIVPSSDPDAYGSISDGILAGTKIAGCLGDQSAALVGQCAFIPGMAKNTYGTGCFLLYNTGYEPVMSENGLLTTVAYAFKGFKPVYALEGSIAVAGSAVKFLRDNLGLIKESGEIGELAVKVPDTGGVVFVTAFSGLFAPYWIDDAQGTIFGITQYTTKEHIARATIEATCYQTKAILIAMEKDSGTALHALAVDGGMSNSDVCMQLQADIMGINVDRPKMRETTALGAAIAAGFAVNVWKEFDGLKDINRDDHKTFSPTTDEGTREKWFNLWSKAVERSRGWVDNDATEEDLE